MRNHKLLVHALYILSVLLCSSCGVMLREEAGVADRETQLKQVMDSISDDMLLAYVKKLSSDDYVGRLTGTPEYKACARWVASRFEEWGLKPAGDNNSFLRSYPNPYTVVFVGGELSYNYRSGGSWKKRKYVYEREYYPGSQSGDGELKAEVVYVGYGITAPELNYDDYAGMNVKGKIVLIDPEAPVSPDKNPVLFKEWLPYSFPRYKIKMAVAHGAKGMLYNYLKVNPDIDYIPGFMVAQVGKAVVKDIFAGTGRGHAEVREKIKNTLKPQSFRTRKTFTIKNFTRHYSKGIGYNVNGLIEGGDPFLKDEVIILGAHLDHVGFCYEIMPGANNNASGVAVMLGVAEAMAKSPIKPKRSILFLGVGSAEQGFRGSKAYLNRPVFSKEKTVVFLNLDMVGCGDKLKALAAQNYPKRWRFVSEANNKFAKRAVECLPFSNIDRPRLDVSIFFDKRIPGISFSVYSAPTYPYTTKDTVRTINPKIMGDLARILYRSILGMANANKDFFKDR